MTSFKIPPSALIFLSGLAIFTIIVSVLSEGMGGGRNFDLLHQNHRQNIVFVPCGYRDGFGLGVLWHIILGAFRFFRVGRLYDWHVAYVCAHRNHCGHIDGASGNSAHPARGD